MKQKRWNQLVKWTQFWQNFFRDIISRVHSQEFYGAAAWFVPKQAPVFNLQWDDFLLNNDETQNNDCHIGPDDYESIGEESKAYSKSHN